MKASQLLRILKDDGWVIKTQKGSHKQMVHPTKKGKVTVSYEGSDDVRIGTYHHILKQAGLKS